MKIEWQDIYKDDLQRSASLILNGEPVLEFELHKDHYVVDWNSKVTQYEFLNILDKLGCPLSAPTIIQSQTKYPKKTNTTLAESISLKDEILFLAFDTEEYGMTWYKQKGGSEKIEFSSKRKNLDMLVNLLNSTFEKFGDKAKTDLDKILHNYK